MPDTEVTGLKVLIVDDSASVRGLIRVLLAEQGYNIVGQLPSGSEVLRTIVQLSPDIVCLDYHLPDIDGLELLRQIKGAHPTVSVVLITGDTDEGLEEIAAEAGAAGFITKPFTPTQIIADLRQVVRARQLLSKFPSSVGDVCDVSWRARAVIADDSATMRTLLSAILKIAGIEVVGEARNGRQAVEMVQQTKPELVCLDWNMPLMNGIDALRTIKHSQASTVALMITGRATRESIIEATQAGAAGYILKPFHPDRVLAAINKALQP
jgi:two-component system chemotaxis response regulator CheY